MKLVIGSGPAGVACAHALLAKGESVTMIDAGITVEASIQSLLSKISEGSKNGFDQLTGLQSNIPISGKGVQLKRAYGSDFPYREAEEHLGFEGNRTGLLPSLALGGFSNVWGAATLPYHADDIKDWPLDLSNLNPHYESILQITGLSGQRDDLLELFPLHVQNLTPLAEPCRAEVVFWPNTAKRISK